MEKATKVISLIAIMGVVAAVTVQVFAAGDVKGPTENSPHGSLSSVKKEGDLPSGHPQAIPSDTNLVNSGKVLEVLDSPTYSFIRVSTKKEPLWLAAYKANVVKGDTVSYSSGIGMPNFHSKSLNRTFDMIVFVDTLEKVKK